MAAGGIEYNEGNGTVMIVRCPLCGRYNYRMAMPPYICEYCGFNAKNTETAGNHAQKTAKIIPSKKH